MRPSIAFGWSPAGANGWKSWKGLPSKDTRSASFGGEARLATMLGFERLRVQCSTDQCARDDRRA